MGTFDTGKGNKVDGEPPIASVVANVTTVETNYCITMSTAYLTAFESRYE